MKIKRLTNVVLICIALLFATTRCAMAQLTVKGYAKVTSIQQGTFTGSSRTPSFQGQIAVVLVSTGTDSYGNTGYIQISKYPDASSAQFQKALANNEILPQVFVQMVKDKIGQFVPKTYVTYSLKNAYIKSIGSVEGAEVILIKSDEKVVTENIN